MKYIDLIKEVDKLGIDSPLAISKDSKLIAKLRGGVVYITERKRKGKLLVAVNLEETGILNFVLGKFGFNTTSLNFWKRSKSILHAHFQYNKQSFVAGRTDEDLKTLSESMDNIIKILDEQIGSIQAVN